MNRRQFLLILVPFFLLILTGMLLYPGKHHPPDGEAMDADVRQTVTFAMVGSEPDQVRASLEPFVSFINQFLEDEEIRINPFVAESKDAIRRAIENGEVDFYLDSPFSVYSTVKTGEMRPVARQWRDGVPEYHAVILSRNGTDAVEIHQLDQLTIAFEDKGSSSSFYLPASMLQKAGYDLVGAGEETGASDRPWLRYRFSTWDKISLDWLLSGEVDLAAVSSIYYDELPDELKSDLHIVRESFKIPRHLIAVRSSIHPAVEDIVVGILMDLETSSEGRVVLREFFNTRRFDPIPYEEEVRQRILQHLGINAWES